VSTAKRTVLTGALVVTMDAERRVVRSGHVVLEDGRIAAVGPGPAPDGPGEVIDVAGAVVLPGFVNTHHHLADFLVRGTAPDYAYTVAWTRRDDHWKGAAVVGEAEAYGATLLSAAELIRSGVTTTTDSLTAWRGRHKSEGALRAAHDSGLRVAHTVAFIDRTTMVPTEFQYAPSEARAEYERLRSLFERDRVTVGSEPLSLPRASDELIRALHDPDGGLHAMHLTYSQEFADWSVREYGRTAIEHLDSLGVVDDRLIGAHPIYLTNVEVAIMAARGASGAFCAVSNMLIGVGILPLHRMRAAGVTVGLGLDYPNHGHNMFETMKMSVLSQKSRELDATVGSAGLALELATIEGAKALGLADRVGSLEVGKEADLLVLDPQRNNLHPPAGVVNLLAYAGSPDDVRSVMVGGEWLMRDGMVARFDEQVARQLATQAQGKVLQANGLPADHLVLPDGWRRA
jgi:5-methylthioadenosine/S-adenosylhomocysteine deaminase